MLDELFVRGGPVLYVLFLITLIIFYILVDKYIFIFLNSKKWLDNKLTSFYKEFPPSTTDYKYVESILINSVSRESKSNIKMLQGLISMCPMIGLLGTVYGMIEVFEILSFLGTGNPRAMSSGVAMATIPTMTGMVISLFGLYFYQDVSSRIDNISKNFVTDIKSKGYRLWSENLEEAMKKMH